MKKLSKAQEKVLNKIRAEYQKRLDEDLEMLISDSQKPLEERRYLFSTDEWIKEKLEIANKGFILWHSTNSRTLEILAEAGYIEYDKRDGIRSIPLDYIKLL